MLNIRFLILFIDIFKNSTVKFVYYGWAGKLYKIYMTYKYTCAIQMCRI